MHCSFMKNKNCELFALLVLAAENYNFRFFLKFLSAEIVKFCYWNAYLRTNLVFNLSGP